MQPWKGSCRCVARLACQHTCACMFLHGQARTPAHASACVCAWPGSHASTRVFVCVCVCVSAPVVLPPNWISG